MTPSPRQDPWTKGYKPLEMPPGDPSLSYAERQKLETFRLRDAKDVAPPAPAAPEERVDSFRIDGRCEGKIWTYPFVPDPLDLKESPISGKARESKGGHEGRIKKVRKFCMDCVIQESCLDQALTTSLEGLDGCSIAGMSAGGLKRMIVRPLDTKLPRAQLSAPIDYPTPTE
jgi:hypothetical protein